MFSLTVCPDEKLRPKFNKIIYQMQGVSSRLNHRIEVSPEEFVKILKKREETHHLADYVPESSADNLWPGTYYLTKVDKKFRRTYARKPREIKLPIPPMPPSCKFI